MAKNNAEKTKQINKVEAKASIKDKFLSFFKKKAKNDSVKKYIKKKNKRNKKKRIVKGKFTLDVLDLLIIIVVTVLVSSILTGFILNFQYRREISYLNSNNVKSEHITEFIDIYTEVVDNFYEEVDQKGMIEAALTGMMGYLEDNYSIYLDKEETSALSQTLDGSYDGIGIVAYGNVVYEIYENSPAEVAGLKAGDEIVEINGNEININNYEKITEYLKHDKDNEVVVIRDKTRKVFNVDIDKVYIPSTSESVIEKADQRIGYITISSFSANAAEDFQNSLLEITEEEDIHSLIIDVRNNTGGYLNSASNIASIFLKKGKVIYSLDSKDGIVSYKDKTKQTSNYKVVVLVNQVSASASEVLATALKDSYGATIVGMKTFGKGSVQTTKKYGDAMIKYTSAKWLRPNGECVDGVGIKPDYEVEVKIENNVMYDKQLDKAIELLS